MTVTKERIIKSLEETIREVKTMPSDKFKVLCNNVKTPCEHCSCNPKNGGSGMCNCTLACPKITRGTDTMKKEQEIEKLKRHNKLLKEKLKFLRKQNKELWNRVSNNIIANTAKELKHGSDGYAE